MSTLNGGPGIITDGLVLYVDAANSYSYVSGSTAWNDLSRGGNNGTINNSNLYSTESAGTLSLTSVSSYVDFGLANFQPTSMTIGAWISRATSPTSTAILVKGNINAATEWGLSFGYNPLLLVGRTTTYNNQITIPWTGSLPNGYHYVCYTTVANTVHSIYTDGVLATSSFTVGSIGLDATTVRAGRWGDFGAGLIGYGNIQLYNRALSAAEILQNYNAQKTRFGL